MAVVSGISLTVPTDLTVSGNLTVTGKAALGDNVNDSIALYGKTKVSQLRSASQGAVTKLTTTTKASPTAVANKVNSLITYSMRVRADLVSFGIIKGAS